MPKESDGPPFAPQAAEARSQAINGVDPSVGFNPSPTSGVSPTPSKGCEEHRRLLDDFGVAVKELLHLHEQQFLAIVQGDSECNRFDLLIHMANEKKQKAKYAYMRHVESHGCSNFDVFNQGRT